MNISELLIPELERETQLTETFLNRVPKDKLEWSPHEKSTPMGRLYAHLVELYSYISDTMDSETLDFATFQPPQLTTIDDMLDGLPDLAAAAEQSLQKDNEVYQQTWTMKNGDKVLVVAQLRLIATRSRLYRTRKVCKQIRCIASDLENESVFLTKRARRCLRVLLKRSTWLVKPVSLPTAWCCSSGMTVW